MRDSCESAAASGIPSEQARSEIELTINRPRCRSGDATKFIVLVMYVKSIGLESAVFEEKVEEKRLNPTVSGVTCHGLD